MCGRPEAGSQFCGLRSTAHTSTLSHGTCARNARAAHRSTRASALFPYLLPHQHPSVHPPTPFFSAGLSFPAHERPLPTLALPACQPIRCRFFAALPCPALPYSSLARPCSDTSPAACPRALSYLVPQSSPSPPRFSRPFFPAQMISNTVHSSFLTRSLPAVFSPSPCLLACCSDACPSLTFEPRRSPAAASLPSFARHCLYQILSPSLPSSPLRSVVCVAPACLLSVPCASHPLLPISIRLATCICLASRFVGACAPLFVHHPNTP